MIKKLLETVLRRLAIRKNVEVGLGFHVGPGSVIWAPRKLLIGKDVYVGKNVTIQVDGQIGDNVLIANSVGIVGRTDHDFSTVGIPIRQADWVGDHPAHLSKTTRIGSDVWIGYGSIILSGVTIGDSAIVAAGSLVKQNVPSNCIVAGSPATFRRKRFTEREFVLHWTTLERQGMTRLQDDEEFA